MASWQKRGEPGEPAPRFSRAGPPEDIISVFSLPGQRGGLAAGLPGCGGDRANLASTHPILGLSGSVFTVRLNILVSKIK